MDFKQFLTESNQSDIEETIKKLPAKYQTLVKGYKFKFLADHGLKNDSKHVGLIDTEKKEITLASGYFSGREFIFLHELSHIVYNLLNNEQKEEWKKLVELYKKQIGENNNEECFCHIFANYYCQNPLVKYNISKLNKFIKKLSEEE